MRKHTWFVLLLGLLFAIPNCTPSKGKPGDEKPGGSDGGVRQIDAPVITSLNPPRASMLTGAQSIKIEGQLNIKGSQVAELKVNGQVVKPAEDGSFSATMNAKWGINMIVVDVINKDGIEGRRAQSFLWAKEYHPMDGTRIDKAAVARLNQPGIDDGNRSTLNDLASILEYVISELDIDPFVPEILAEGDYKIPPIGPTVKYVVKKTGKLEIGRRKVKITSRNDGLSLWAELKDLKLPLKGTAAKYLNKAATVLAPSVTINADVDLRIANKQIIVDILKVDIDVSKIEVKAFSGIFSFLNGTVTKAVRNALKTRLEDTIKTMVPPLVKLFLGGFKFARDFTLPAFLGSKVISLDSGIDHLVFDKEGGTIGLAASISSELAIGDGKRGTPIRSQTAPKWSSGYAFGIGLSYNVLNQLLVAAWQSGALNQDLTPLLASFDLKLPLDAKNLKVSVSAKLPPILHPGSFGSDVDVGIGDLLLILDFDKSDGTKGRVEAYLSARIAANLTLNKDNELVFSLKTESQVLRIDVIKIEGFGTIAPGEFTGILRTLGPQITQLLSAGLLQKFPIPSFDLGALAGQFGIPPGTTLSLQNAKSSLVGDYVKVTGDL